MEGREKEGPKVTAEPGPSEPGYATEWTKSIQKTQSAIRPGL